MKQVTALVVTYNRLKLLKGNIAAITAQTYPVKHILVIDNNSQDGTKEYLDSLQIGGLIVKHLAKNLGGSGGFYEGIKIFEEQLTDDFVWIMDDDTIPTSTTLKELSQCWSTIGQFGFLASNVRWIDGKPAVMNVPAIDQAHWSSDDLEISDNIFYPRVSSASFVSLLVPREVISIKGLPYKEFFIWEDDAEYTSRISREYSCYFVPESIVHHKTKSNDGIDIIDESGSRLSRYFYLFRNKTFRARKAKGAEKIKSLGRIGIEYGQVLFSHGVNQRFKKLGIMSKGIIKGMYFNPKIHYVLNAKTKGD